MLLPPDTDEMALNYGIRPTQQMTRQAGPKTRSRLQTTLPHRKHGET
jgi:hypothetical protein